MRVSGRLIALAAGGLLAATGAGAKEVSIARGLLGPEGPLVVDGALYFVGWNSDTLSRWNG